MLSLCFHHQCTLISYGLYVLIPFAMVLVSMLLISVLLVYSFSTTVVCTSCLLASGLRR